MAERQEGSAPAEVPADVEALTRQILAQRPGLDVDVLREQVRGLREAASALDDVRLSNSDEPAAAFAIWREED